MPAAARIPAQAPDLSPTFLASTTDRNPSRPSVRRNLFSGHLSRRPASSTTSDLGPSQNASQRQQFHTNSQPQPHVRFPSPVRNGSFHQRSPPPQAPSPISAFTPPPHLQLQPTIPAAMTSKYDPSVSPHHPLSPGTATVLFPSSSIIAVHPATGRPLLPNIPHLPARLKFSEGDDDEGEQAQPHEEEDQEQPHGGSFELPPDYHNVPAVHTMGPGRSVDLATAEYLDELESERRERERIARMLSEMMVRQRNRAKVREHYSEMRNHHLQHRATSHHHHITKKSGTTIKSSRPRRKPRGITNTNNHKSPYSPSAFSDDEGNINTAGLGLDAFIDPDEDMFDISSAMYPRNDGELDDEFSERWEHEREELMGLIMASLRRKVATAESELWIYGGYSGPGDGNGTDEFEDPIDLGVGSVGGLPMGGIGAGAGVGSDAAGFD